jgi:hypothetical protein
LGKNSKSIKKFKKEEEKIYEKGDQNESFREED